MAKGRKAAKAPKKEEKEKKPDDFSAAVARLPKDQQKKLMDIKAKLDTFKKAVLAKFDRYVMGVALLPPQQPQQQQGPTMTPQPQQQQPQPPADQINALVLIDDADSKKMTKQELKAKLEAIIKKMAEEQDRKLAVQVILLSEVWQSCFDGKYDLLQLIALAAPVHDRGMLAALKIAEVHKNMVIRKFERYIVSYVLAGSLVQGRATEKSDIDVFIVVDDTDVKRMTRAELKDKLRAIIIGMGLEAGDATGIKNKINIQVYILTDFWDSIKEANPIIFTFLRDGVPLYDRGTFMPWKQLLQMGRIKPSQEAIEMYMNTGDQIISRVKYKLREIGMEDTFWSILTPTQAALMLYGVPPPTPKETPDVLRELFVKKEKMLEEEFVKILERHIDLRKDLEHGDKKELTGAEVDRYVADADRYLKRLEKLFKALTEWKEKESVVAAYDGVVTMVRDVLRLEGIESVSDSELLKTFELELVTQGKVPAKYFRILHGIIKAKKDYDAGKLTKAEVELVRKDAGELTKFITEYMQLKRGKEIEKARLRVKHGSRYGEVILLQDEAFIIHDVDNEQKEVSRATILADGGIGTPKRTTIEELEHALANRKIPERAFIKEKIFENLRDFFGKDVEVQVTK